MKILIVHNEYKFQGGEDTVVEAESALLRKQGHDVQFYKRSNHELDSISRAGAAASTLWSPRTVKDMNTVCKAFRPDIIHSHNTFPLVSPSVYWAAGENKVPVIQTLHNFRLLCPQAMFLREGKVCEKCVGRMPWPAVAHQCYRGSALQSAVALTMLSGHRMLGTYRNKVNLYIALNESGRDKFIQGGLPADRIRVKPNFVDSSEEPDFSARKYGMFVGRLSEEKGLQVLADAVRHLAGVQIRVAGAGPLEDMARRTFGDNYVGVKSAAELVDMLAQSSYAVIPSIGIESFGMVAIEAFACGTPVIASRHGGLSDIVTDGVTGLLVNPSDARDLAEKIQWAESHPEDMMKMGRAARSEYERKYTSDRNYAILMDIYKEALATGMVTQSHRCAS